MLDPTDIAELEANLDKMSPEELAEALEALEELEHREYAQRCRDDLIAFCLHMEPKYLVGAHHKQLASLLMDIEQGREDRIAVSVPPRHGKQCAHDTWVPTPKGYKRHGDLQPGDQVYAPDGRPIRVVAVGPESLQDIEVELTNGQIIRVHENHEWAVYDRRKNEKRRHLEVRETRDLMQEVWIGSKGVRGSRARWQLPDVDALYNTPKNLPLHPYALGVWLGNGTTNKPAITGVDQEVFDRFAKVTGFKETQRHVHATTGVTTVAYAGPRPKVRGQLSEVLHQMELLGNKHIPQDYLLGDKRQRLQLLAGLMDTDGSVEAHTGRCRYVTTLPELAQQVLELVNGLGFRGYMTQQEAKRSTSGVQGRKTVYTIGFQPTETYPAAVPRKRTTKVAMRRKVAIADIRRVEPHLGRCIQVSTQEGLYVVGKTHIPTHNSFLVSTLYIAWYLGRNPSHQVLLISHTGDLAVNFGRKIRNLVDDPKYREIFPDIELAADSKSAGRWNTNKGGQFFATGVGSALAGRGADLCLDAGTKIEIDDGIALIKDVLVGDRIRTAYGWQEVTNKLLTIHEEAVKINNDVVASLDHPFRTKKGWVKVKDLQVGDRILTLTLWRRIWLTVTTPLKTRLARRGKA